MNIAPQFDWTPEAIVRLRQLADGTRSATEIATTLGCGRNAVIGKIHRLAKAGKADGIRLMPGGGNRGRGGRKATGKPAKAKPGPVAVSWANGKRIAPKKGKPSDPVFLSASRAEETTPEALPAIAPDHALVLPPMRFAEAIALDRCLYFSGDPYGISGPAMPVCGAERPEWKGDRSRYCVRHRLLQYAPREAGRAAA